MIGVVIRSKGVGRRLHVTHRMRAAEISYDLVMKDEMEFVEGAFRLPDSQWQVFVTLRREISDPQLEPATWQSGVSGVNLLCPHSMTLNANVVQSALGRQLGVDVWIIVRGPDSMALR